MRFHGIPVIQPIPLANELLAPTGCSQPIIQFKELAPDQVRRAEYRNWLDRQPPRKKRKNYGT